MCVLACHPRGFATEAVSRIWEIHSRPDRTPGPRSSKDCPEALGMPISHLCHRGSPVPQHCQPVRAPLSDVVGGSQHSPMGGFHRWSGPRELLGKGGNLASGQGAARKTGKRDKVDDILGLLCVALSACDPVGATLSARWAVCKDKFLHVASCNFDPRIRQLLDKRKLPLRWWLNATQGSSRSSFGPSWELCNQGQCQPLPFQARRGRREEKCLRD